MIEVSDTTEHSEELKALALKFCSVNEQHRVERTETFMSLSTSLRDMKDYIDQLLSTMQSNKPFNKLHCEDPKFGIDGYNSPISSAINSINDYSMESMFKTIHDQARRKAEWGIKHRTRKLPHAEALAWIAYFTKWDSEQEKRVMNDNWISYYKETYPSIKS